MSTEITLSLTDDLVGQAEILAKRTGRELGVVLSDVLHLSFDSIGSLTSNGKPWLECEDEEVLSCCELAFDKATEIRFSELLERQREEKLTENQRNELYSLMQQYKDGLLLKAEAINEAVRRGIRSPA